MIRVDRKVCHDIMKVTDKYNVSILFHPDLGGYCKWHGTHPDSPEVVPSVQIEEIPSALDRLISRGMIEKVIGVNGHGMIFRIRPELLHAKAFWFDSFSKKFIGGFVSGILTTVVSSLILHFLTGLF